MSSGPQTAPEGLTSGISQGLAGVVETEARKPLRDFIKNEDGSILWNASVVLMHYFQQKLPAKYFEGKRVLELGSGVGLVGIQMAQMGAHVTCTELPDMLAVLERNVADAMLADGGEAFKDGTMTRTDWEDGRKSVVTWRHPGGGSIRCWDLAWGEQGWRDSPIPTQVQARVHVTQTQHL
jgi:hypothetical protein